MSRPPRHPASVGGGSAAHATVLATGLFIGGLMCGALAGRAAVARVQDPYTHLDLFARVLATVESDFVEPVPPRELVDAAVRGLVSRLDSQSRWLDGEQLQELRDDASGTTTGLGLTVAPHAEGAVVVRVVDGSPASREGLQPGDRILAINGLPVLGLGSNEVIARLAGRRGEVAELTVMREGWRASRTIRSVRAEVHREVVDGALLPGRVAYVRVRHFQDGTARDLQEQVLEIADRVGGMSGLAGLVVDVRDNPGGLLSEAVAVADLFLDDGVIVSTRARSAGEPSLTYRATLGGLAQDLRVVLLINGMSASASEILAGALQDTGRGVLVGQPTYGKGTVQKVFLYGERASSPAQAGASEAALKLTVGRYYTPSGAPVAPKEGRVPDHQIALDPEPGPVSRLREQLDHMLLDAADRRALLALVDALPDDPPAHAHVRWDLPIPERLAVDPQLELALDLLSR